MKIKLFDLVFGQFVFLSTPTRIIWLLYLMSINIFFLYLSQLFRFVTKLFLLFRITMISI